MPKSPPRRARCAACALATMALVGVHPVFTHVPPKSLRSTSATLRPALARRTASDGPAWPAPKTSASKLRFICPPSDPTRQSLPQQRLQEVQRADRAQGLQQVLRELPRL